MRDIYRIIGLVIVVIVAMLGVLAVLHLLMSLPFLATSHLDKRAEWFGAIGTVLTLAGTIWLATSESRRRHRDALLVARLHALGMYWRLAMIHAQVDTGAADIKRATVEQIVRTRRVIKADLDNLNIWTMEDLIPLVPLGGKLVANLAQAGDRLKWALAYMVTMERMTPLELMRFAPIAVEMLATSAALINSAMNECANATAAIELK